jgi:hypothetical protein
LLVHCNAYVSIAVRVTLIGKEENLQQCWKATKSHIDGCVLTQECDELPLHIWNQTSIYNFYKYCVSRRVLPQFDSTNQKLTLLGGKDDVGEATLEFYRMKCRISEEESYASYDRIAVWVYETRPDNVEKYSLKLNALIESAYSQKKDEV